jgi:hypothetical protein
MFGLRGSLGVLDGVHSEEGRWEKAQQTSTAMHHYALEYLARVGSTMGRLLDVQSPKPYR